MRAPRWRTKRSRVSIPTGRAWYRLGNSLYQTKRYDAAIAALQKATATLRPHPSPTTSSPRCTPTPVARTRRSRRSGGRPRRRASRTRSLPATPSFASLAGNPAYDELMTSLNPCSPRVPPVRLLDRRMGRPDPGGQPASFSRIESDFGGCMILEHWSGLTGIPAGTRPELLPQGRRPLAPELDRRAVEQPAVASRRARREGRDGDDGRRPEREPAQPHHVDANPDGTVRQHWGQSTDGGATWTTAFDGLYVPREPAAD